MLSCLTTTKDMIVLFFSGAWCSKVSTLIYNSLTDTLLTISISMKSHTAIEYMHRFSWQSCRWSEFKSFLYYPWKIIFRIESCEKKDGTQLWQQKYEEIRWCYDVANSTKSWLFRSGEMSIFFISLSSQIQPFPFYYEVNPPHELFNPIVTNPI